MNFPIAIAATVIALLVVLWGHALARRELLTGTAKGYDFFLVVVTGFASAILYLGLRYEFFWTLLGDLVGMLIGGGIVVAAVQCWHALRRARRR